MPASLLERSKASSIIEKSDMTKRKKEYMEIEPEISNPASLLERSIVKKKPKDEFVEIPFEGEEKETSLLERSMVKKEKGHQWEKKLVHWILEKPEEHKYLHALAEDIREKCGITGATPAERFTCLSSRVEHGLASGVKGLIERKRVELGGMAEPTRVVPPSEYVKPIEQVVPQEAEMVEMPEREVPAVSRFAGAIPEKEILICRKLRDVV